MPNTTISPNMGMPIPVVEVDPGPDWAQNINASLLIVDGHNHTPGSGTQIPSSGININADLPFNANNATLLRTARFVSQSAALALATDIGCIYEVGVDLYYNDGLGNQIRITQSGSVTGATGTITGLPSGTASASYSAGVFTFESATATPAQMNVGPVNIGQAVASGFGTRLLSNAALATNIDVTLPPSLPLVTGYMQMDTLGDVTIQGVVVPGTSDGLVSLNGLPGNTTGNPIASGYVGQVIYGPANKNTNGLISFTSSAAWKNFQSITVSAGVWWVVANFQLQAGDNSTVFSTSTSTDFDISASTASGVGANGGFACIDYNSLYLSNVSNNSGNIASGTIGTILTPSTTTIYYLNANCTYTGTAPKGRGGMMAVRIG